MVMKSDSPFALLLLEAKQVTETQSEIKLSAVYIRPRLRKHFPFDIIYSGPVVQNLISLTL
jgi:hypothetical protein